MVEVIDRCARGRICAATAEDSISGATCVPIELEWCKTEQHTWVKGQLTTNSHCSCPGLNSRWLGLLNRLLSWYQLQWATCLCLLSLNKRGHKVTRCPKLPCTRSLTAHQCSSQSSCRHLMGCRQCTRHQCKQRTTLSSTVCLSHLSSRRASHTVRNSNKHHALLRHSNPLCQLLWATQQQYQVNETRTRMLLQYHSSSLAPQ